MHLPFLFLCLPLVLASTFEDTLKNAFCLYSSNQRNPHVDCHENSVCAENKIKTSHFTYLNETLKPPQLICRSTNEMSLSWNDGDISSSFLELFHPDFPKNRNYTKPTHCNRWILNDLPINYSYRIVRWKAWIKNDSYFFESSEPLMLKIHKSDSLLPIPNFNIKALNVNGDSYDAIVRWTPAKDMPCRYRLDAFGVTNGEHVSKAVSFPFPPYEERLSGLQFDHTYNITIRAVRPSRTYPFAESPPSYTLVDIPPCLEAYSNLTICAPPPPEDASASGVCDPDSGKCDVTIVWASPQLTPDEYVIFIYDLNGEGDDVINTTVSGVKNSAVLEDVPVGTYEIMLRAVSEAGRGAPAILTASFMVHPEDLHSSTMTTKLAVILAALLAALLLGVTIFVLKRRRRRRFGTQVNSLYSKELLKINVPTEKTSGQIVKKVIDEWEFPADSVEFEGILGEGAFGLVKKGVLKKADGQTVHVAVKMLKPHSSQEEARQLYQEIAIMKSVGTHPNLVSMIGCVTQERLEGPLLLVEYCPNGDLQSYLRKEWERLSNFYRDTNQAETDGSDYNILNKAYVFDNTDQFLTPNDLLSFARQIALGMEHLSKLRVLHRDLAARNVLVCENKLVKVSDFGLSRDVYQNNVYCKLGGGKLPIRWMALESITHQRYTTQSDVWSFGVLLWEIVTLGEHPYPEVGNGDLVNFLKSGYRMAKPPHCGMELYEIMLKCWRENPKERPTFTEIRKRLEMLLEDALNYVKL